jgi:hypothetical protein
VDTNSGTYAGNKQITVTPLVNNGNQTGIVSITPNVGTPIEYRFYPLHHENGISRFIYPISQGVGQYFNVGQTVQLYIKFPYVLTGNSTPTLTFKKINVLDKDSVDVTFVSKGRTPDDAYTFVYNLKGKAVAPIRDGYGDATMTFTYTLNGETKDLEFYYRVKGNSTPSGDDSGSSSGGSSNENTTSGTVKTNIGSSTKCHVVDNTVFVNGMEADGYSNFKINVSAPSGTQWYLSNATAGTFVRFSPAPAANNVYTGTGSQQITVSSKNLGNLEPTSFEVGGFSIKRDSNSTPIVYRVVQLRYGICVCQCPLDGIVKQNIKVGQTVQLYVKFPKNWVTNNGTPTITGYTLSVPGSLEVGEFSTGQITPDDAYTFVCSLKGLTVTSGSIRINYTSNKQTGSYPYNYRVID